VTATVAAFDVDGTITRRDCVVPFMRRVAGARRIVPRLAARPRILVPSLIRRDRDALKALAAAASFRGMEGHRLAALGAEFAQHVHASWLRPDTMDTLTGHLTAGDRVVLVSASFEVYLQPLAELLGVDHVLATRLEHRNGVYTGALDGPNCRGAEKVRRLHDWLDDGEVGGRSNIRLVAYGDSAGDRELLADADEARWVTPDGMPR
jgi:phosphatidylglycerophosphatase C